MLKKDRDMAQPDITRTLYILLGDTEMYGQTTQAFVSQNSAKRAWKQLVSDLWKHHRGDEPMPTNFEDAYIAMRATPCFCDSATLVQDTITIPIDYAELRQFQAMGDALPNKAEADNPDYRVTVILGEDAVRMFAGEDMVLTNDNLDAIKVEGSVVDRVFQSVEAYDAFIEGVDLGVGWLNWHQLSEDEDERDNVDWLGAA